MRPTPWPSPSAISTPARSPPPSPSPRPGSARRPGRARHAAGATTRRFEAAMIAVLRGNLLEKHPSRLIVDVHGVGYDVQVPVSTFYQAGEPGADVTLRIHTHVREDQIALFGFATALEHDLFERLIGVNGIGPKLALSVLSGIESADFIRAGEQGDVTRLTRIPGVGRKTAERMTLELRDRLPKIDQGSSSPG